jgi:hypothetical protein
MHHLTDYQRRKLLENPNVQKITDKHVVFSAKFKVKSVEKYLKGFSPDEIFKQESINLNFFKINYAQYCIKKWKKKYLEQGKEAFEVEKRGSGSTGRPKSENLEKLTYDELLAIIEIQKGVIEDIKKKKALATKKF